MDDVWRDAQSRIDALHVELVAALVLKNDEARIERFQSLIAVAEAIRDRLKFVGGRERFQLNPPATDLFKNGPLAKPALDWPTSTRHVDRERPE